MPATATRKKLLLLITNFGPGGAQRVFHDHSTFLSERYDISEAVFDKDELPNLYESGKPLYSLDVKGGSDIKGKIDNFRQRCIRLKSIIAREKTDLCVSHMDGANWVNVLSHSRARKILCVHGTVLHDYAISSWLRILRKKVIIPFLYNKAALTVAVSDGIKYELEHYCGVKRVIAIPNFFDTKAIQAMAALPLPGEWEQVFAGNEVLITSGRLHIQKKQRYLLPLLKRLLPQRPKLKLIILGDGDLRDELIAEAKGLGLGVYFGWDKEQVLSSDYDLYFPGYISNPFQFLKRSTLFVFPSGWEGFPLALCEAMISGVPVVAADCPTGPREIIKPGTFDAEYTLREIERTQYGYLMPMVDKAEFEPAWITAINELLDDAEARAALVPAGQERMKEYDKSVAMEKWFSVIDGVLKG